MITSTLKMALIESGPVGQAMSSFVTWLLDNASPLFQVINSLINGLAGSLESILKIPEAWLFTLVVALISVWRVSLLFGLFSLLGLNLVLYMGLWEPMLTTLGLVIASSLLALFIGIPIGIISARSKTLWLITRPVLDLMQTMPAFVYLIPAVMFFSTGPVPSTIATLIFLPG